MTRPDIEATLQATYSELAWKAVAGVLFFGICAAVIVLVGRIAHG
jgi:hypothetical protein